MNLKALTKEQAAAVQNDASSLLILAGPGTGKTKVLEYKAAHLLENGYDPASLIVITPTQYAAQQMKRRVFELSGSHIDKMWFGTFPSILAFILREEDKSIPFSKTFSIYDSVDAASVVENILAERELEYTDLTPQVIQRKISYLKSLPITPEQFAKKPIKPPFDKRFFEIYAEYQERIKFNEAWDFEDLALQTLLLFKKNKRVLTKYKRLLKYILIDDFQEISKPQYDILKLVVGKDTKFCFAADDAQSIMVRKGAHAAIIPNTIKDFPKITICQFTTDFRLSKEIFHASESIIKNHKTKYEHKTILPKRNGDIATIMKCSDEKDEAYQIAKLLQDEVMDNKRQLKEFAIFYRTSQQARAFEDAFRMESIPFITLNGAEYYRKREEKDILAYLRAIENPRDAEALLRIMNFPQRGIGLTTIKRMVAFGKKQKLTLFETMGRVYEVIDIKERIQKNVRNFKILLDKYISLKYSLSLSELVRALIDELGVLRTLKEEQTIDSINKLQNIQELLREIDEFQKKHPRTSISAFLQSIVMMSDIEYLNNDENVVRIMTVHSTKGLEFPVVFLSGLEEDILPLAQRFSPEATVEEERRICYVAFTRAKEKIYLSHARARYRFGEVAYQNRSRFVDEIKPQFITDLDLSSDRKKNRKTKRDYYYEQFESLPFLTLNQLAKVLKPTCRVMHSQFGIGKVVSILGIGETIKATVMFEGNNLKQLMLKYAQLKVLP